MAINLKLCTTIISLLILFSSSPSCADFVFSQPDTICNLTHYPSFCRTILPSRFSGSINDHAQFFLHQSLSTTKMLLQLISSYLNHQSTIPAFTVLALQDCQYLAELNSDFLSNTLQTIQNTLTLSSFQLSDLKTFLSAILTNQQTCLDGLHEVTPYTSTASGLLRPLSDGTKLYSISLALFTRAWEETLTEKKKILEKSMNTKLLQTNIDNVVVRQKVVVNPDGSGDYTTINDAVADAPTNTGTDNGYHVIYVAAGIYNEYVSVAKNQHNLMIVGDGIDRTVITGNRNVVDGWTTFQSATFAVTGKGFVAVNITFRNTAGASKHQAVAVRNGADMSAFYNCSLEGYQDTLYAHSLRQFYTNCDIYGTVDFIFGNAAAVFQNCNLYPKLPLQNQFNAITAQGRTDPNQITGISIQNCNIRAANDLPATNDYEGIKTYLGRPWKEYSRTAYMKCFIDSLIDPKGWIEWSGDYGVSTLYYAEFGNWGAGSDYSNRIKWPGYHLINATDADYFTVSQFIQGDSWLPNTGVPFKAGLE